MKESTHCFDSIEFEEFLGEWLVTAEYINGEKPIGSTFLVFKNKIDCPVSSLYNYDARHSPVPCLKKDREYFESSYFKGSVLITDLNRLYEWLVGHNKKYSSKHNIGVFFSRRQLTSGNKGYRLNLLYYADNDYYEFSIPLKDFKGLKLVKK